VARWVEHYNTVRLHCAIGYVTPADDEEPVLVRRNGVALERLRDFGDAHQTRRG